MRMSEPDPESHRLPRRTLASRTRPAGHGRPATVRPDPASASERFRTLDRYRVEREWKRYEGTPQRDLFRELRNRFLLRHRPSTGWSIDIGSGPGRFAGVLGGTPDRRILLDLSEEMLHAARERAPTTRPTAALVRGDGSAPPFREGRFSQVVALGNPLGFAGDGSDRLFDSLRALVAPGGTLLLEIVCGPGERSRYLARLPPGAIRRLLAAPVNLVRTRAEREGFRREPSEPRRSSEFRRHDCAEVLELLTSRGFRWTEVLSVAPGLGADAERVAAVRPDPLGWLRLLELEEQIGRAPNRYPAAAALLIAAVRTP
jgi:SAM-dependent methyltransferase